MPDYSEFDAMLQRGSSGELGPGYSQSRALMKAKSRVRISDLPDELAPTQVCHGMATSGACQQELAQHWLPFLHVVEDVVSHQQWALYQQQFALTMTLEGIMLRAVTFLAVCLGRCMPY